MKPWLWGLGFAATSVGLTACAATEGRATDGGVEAADTSFDAGQVDTVPPLPSAARCNDVPLGRAYISVDGSAREGDRIDLALGAERDVPVVNSRWYHWEVESAMYSALDSYPHHELFQTPGVEGTFNGVRPDHTYARINQGPLTAMKLFEIAFQICLAEIDARRSYSLWDDDKYQSSPTRENATAFCETVMARAFHRAPAADELETCVAHAIDDVRDEPDPRRQWASICGTVAAAVELWTR